MPLRNLLSLLACCFVLTACDQDPLHQNLREISSPYSLEQWEDGRTYYLVDTTKPPDSSGGGVLGGTVQKIAWNRLKILVKRSSIFRGDPDGWMVVDLKSHVVSGPFAYPDALRLTGTSNLQVFEAADAWAALR